MIRITSEGGRIGELWWFNSDTTARRWTTSDLHFYRWGTFGIGRNVRMVLEMIDE